jgi:hypothetical protein
VRVVTPDRRRPALKLNLPRWSAGLTRFWAIANTDQIA